MYLARVLGPVVTPVQHPFFDRRTLLLVRRVAPNGRETGPDRIAVDAAQTGEGDLVLVLEEGNSARQIVDDPRAPLRSVIVGFVDEVELDGVIALRNGDASPPAAPPAPAAPERKARPRKRGRKEEGSK